MPKAKVEYYGVAQTRAKLFDNVVAKLPADVESLKDIAEAAEVCPQTLHNWIWGDTMNPHINTLVKVAGAMGFNIVLARRKGNVVRLRK